MAKFSRTKRVFLIGTGVVSGALVLGTTLAWRRVANAQSFKPPVKEGETAFNAWLKIMPDSTVVVQVPRQDMGQGIYTTLAMLVAEELDADWSKVRAEQSQINPVYGNIVALGDSAPPAMKSAMMAMARVIGLQLTGGSTSVRDGWEPMRTAAASARAMLLAAAAAKWNVPVAELTIEKSIVKHAASGKSAPFGELALAAAALTPPSSVMVKAQKDWKILGTSPARLDVVDKTLGKTQFGIDVRLEGMLYATVKHIPYVSGHLQEVRWKNGAPPKDVLHLARGDNWLAVVSTSYWSAKKALDEAALVGGGDTGTVISSEQLAAQYNEVLDGKKDGALKPLRRTFGEHGNAEKAIASATKPQRIDAAYSVPFQAHAPMEPMNCTVRIAGEGKDRKVDVWVGNQAPTVVQWLAAGNVGVPSENVTIHTPYLGGGFGRRVDLEVIRQALACAKLTGGKPVQLIWSREEDLAHDAYRPAISARMSAVLDDKGGLSAWHHRMVGPSVGKSVFTRLNPLAGGDFPPDVTNAEGAAHLPYALAHFKCDHAQVDLPVPLGFWRSVGNSYNAFFVETFIDEIAFALKKDPYLFRLELLKDQPRFAKVVDAAASAAGWSSALPGSGKGWGRGIALAESFKSIVCQVVDVEVVGKDIKVRRVVSAVDCGTVLHPENAKAQISSAAIYGITAALKSQITLKDGQVQQRNFDTFPLLKMAECPQFETVIVNSGEALGGIGEVGVPPIAPALGNAIFAATGKRLRNLPFVIA